MCQVVAITLQAFPTFSRFGRKTAFKKDTHVIVTTNLFGHQNCCNAWMAQTSVQMTWALRTLGWPAQPCKVIKCTDCIFYFVTSFLLLFVCDILALFNARLSKLPRNLTQHKNLPKPTCAKCKAITNILNYVYTARRRLRGNVCQMTFGSISTGFSTFASSSSKFKGQFHRVPELQLASLVLA